MNACEMRCYHEPNCVSINFNYTASAMGTYRCDLNNATHRGHYDEFVDTEGYSYRGADVSSSPSSPSLFFRLLLSRLSYFVYGKWSKLLSPNRIDPPNQRIDGGLCLHPLSQRQVMVFIA